MKSSIELYNAVANEYSNHSRQRSAYLHCVEDLVRQWAGHASRYLDVGAGDGVRSLRVASAIGADHVVLLDTSTEMLRRVPDSMSVVTVVGSIDNCDLAGPFDLITSLWNVFGHMPDCADRKASLSAIARLMSPTSKFILDVNNRYNAAHYGLTAAARNIYRDMVRSPRRGRFPLEFNGCKSEVYIHHPFELDRLARECGLKVCKKAYVHYGQGTVHRMFWSGQAVYCFEKSE